MKEAGIPVLVTTEKGVFFGYMVGDPIPYGAGNETKYKVILRECRMAVYWDAGTHGVLGLAKTGPSEKCRISPAASRATIYNVTLVAGLVTDRAVERWESEPWAG